MPVGVGATQGLRQVLLTWSKDSSGISGVSYNIYVSTSDANSPEELMAKGVKKYNADSSKTWYTHTGLQSGQTYYYVVTAVGESESAPSSIVSVTL
jgi:fibronectin type 3 domain-containing protein